MYGLSFHSTRAVERPHPARADIAFFVGWTTRRTGAAVPRAISEWLRGRNFSTDASLLDVPVPIDTWEAFDELFDWHARPVQGRSERADDWLGLALRDFFANGGRKAYVLRLGSPWALGNSPAGDALTRLKTAMQQAWTLEDVSFVLAPDLPELHADTAESVAGDPGVPALVPEVFVECGTQTFATPPMNGVRLLPAPRLSDAAFERWNATVLGLRDTLALQRRDLMLLVAAPLAARNSRAARKLGAAVTLQTSMVECATPWLRPLREVRTPEGLIPPDGALAGLIAAGVLANGPVRPAAGQAPQGVLAVYPQPRDEELRSPDREQTAADLRRAGMSRADWPLAETFALFGPTANGIRLLSDPSLSAIREWRSAGVVRLLGQLLRTARIVGATLVFEPSGEELWARVRSRFEDMLAAYWQAGALRGSTAAEAFSVRCDRSVMTQNDLDTGRVIVLVQFAPQAAIEHIRIELALAEDGSVNWQDADTLAETAP